MPTSIDNAPLETLVPGLAAAATTASSRRTKLATSRFVRRSRNPQPFGKLDEHQLLPSRHAWPRCFCAAGLARSFHIGVDHDFDQLAEADFRFPIENPFRFRRIANQQVHLGRTFVTFVVPDVFLPIKIDPRESDLEKFADGVRLVRREDEVVALSCCTMRHIPSTYSGA